MLGYLWRGFHKEASMEKLLWRGIPYGEASMEGYSWKGFHEEASMERLS